MSLRKLNMLKSIIFGIILALITISIASVLLPSYDDYQLSNPYWNGLEIFMKNTNAIPINYEKIPPENAILFIIGPSVSIENIEKLKEYVLEGGTIVIMDETGLANSILSGLGLNIRINGSIMLDPVFYYEDWKLPKVFNIVSSDIMQDVNSIILNVPSILEIKDSKAIVLAYSSSFSFLDLDGNYDYSNKEPTGPFPIAAMINYGKGKIIVFSDSSIFINSIINLGDNLKLLHNIINNKKVFIDTSLWQLTPQIMYRNMILSAYKILSFPEFKYSLVITTIMIIYMVLHKSKIAISNEEINEIIKNHPEWNEKLLKAIEEARRKIVRYNK
jgi:hypothetical protein